MHRVMFQLSQRSRCTAGKSIYNCYADGFHLIIFTKLRVLDKSNKYYKWYTHIKSLLVVREYDLSKYLSKKMLLNLSMGEFD